VQGSPSSQPAGAPATHCPPLQASPTVQSSPSSQGEVSIAPTQATPAQASGPVQSLPSSHGPAFGDSTHPEPGAQAATAQGLSVVQTKLPLPLQTPISHRSSVEQASPSSHGAPSALDFHCAPSPPLASQIRHEFCGSSAKPFTQRVEAPSLRQKPAESLCSQTPSTH
jgi:hypothetical protein